ADSFDAMTSDRPYRPGLSRRDALAEIERNLGTQFHPTVGKAFVAVQRGFDPAEVLTADELAEIRSASAPYRLGAVPGRRDLKERPELLALGGLVVLLAGLGFHETWLAALGAWVGASGVVLALSLRRETSALVGFLVVEAPRLPPRHVELALRDATDEIGLALADAPASGGSGGEHAEPLEAAADRSDLVVARFDER